MAKKPLALRQVYQIKVTLKNFRPPIWRRLLITSDTTLPKFHIILQKAMGWTNSHLHEFKVGATHYGEPDPDFDSIQDEFHVRLSKIVTREKIKFSYIYDFGDDWLHDILVEKILPMEAGRSYPRCIKGKRACPPEDIGGVWGYGDFLEIMQDPEHPEYEDMSDWIGGEFDAEYFDLDEINAFLSEI